MKNGKERSRERHRKIVEAIRAETAGRNDRALRVGHERENIVETALGMLVAGKKISWFMRTAKLGYDDVMRGIDFYVSFAGGGKHRFLKLSVTGPRGIEPHRGKHPDIPIIAVDCGAGTEAAVETARRDIADAIERAVSAP